MLGNKHPFRKFWEDMGRYGEVVIIAHKCASCLMMYIYKEWQQTYDPVYFIFSLKNQNTKYEDILFICPCMCASSISFIVLSVFRSRYLKRWFCKFWIYFSYHSWPELLMKLLSALSKTIHQKITLNAYSKIFTSKCCILTFPTKIPLWKTMHCNAWFTDSQREPQRLCLGSSM